MCKKAGMGSIELGLGSPLSPQAHEESTYPWKLVSMTRGQQEY